MRALVLSGGGSKGAYEAGVVSYLMDTLNFRYDIICGVSVGALNAVYLAQMSKGVQTGRFLTSLWTNYIDNSKVYKNWLIPYVSGLWKPSVYNSKPLQNLINNYISTDNLVRSGIKIRIGATNLASGEYRVFDETYHDLKIAVQASSAFPGLLTPVELEGDLWADGGIRSNTPLSAAIQAGADSVDMVLCSPSKDPGNFFSERKSALEVAARAISLMTDQIEADDLNVCLKTNELVKAGVSTDKKLIQLRVIRPNQGLTSNPLDFTPSLLKTMYNQGMADAKLQVVV
jgi:NTE family protein